MPASASSDSFHSAVENESKERETAEQQEGSFANASVSDTGTGAESFDDYSNDDRGQVPAQMPLNDFGQDAEDVGFAAVNWGHFLVAGTVWFIAPMWLGITRMLRAEVK